METKLCVAISVINNEIFQQLKEYDDSPHLYSAMLSSDGYSTIVTFLGYQIWNNDDFNDWEDERTQEELELYLRENIRKVLTNVVLLDL